MTNSRQKGATFERQIARDLDALLGIKFKRKLDQYQERDQSDLTPSDPAFPFSLECKSYAKGTECKPAWEAQAIRAAQNEGKHPAVVFKFNNHPVVVRIWSDAYAESLGTSAVDGVKLDLSLEHFAHVCREIMAIRAMRGAAE